MAVDTQTPAAVAPAKERKKRQSGTAKKPTTSVADLIVGIVSASNEKGGVSLAALKKTLGGKGYDVTKNNARVKMALKNLVIRGVLVQVSGTGASGSFKLNKKKPEPKKAAKSGATKSTARSRTPKPQKKKQSTKEKKSTAAKVTGKAKKDKKAGNRKNIEKPVKTSKLAKPAKSRSVKPKTVQVKSAKGRKTGPSKK